MAVNPFLQASVSGMRSQAYALNVIGTNVANVNSAGYKRTDVQFETLLSKEIGRGNSDVGGVKPKSYLRAAAQGIVESTDNGLDVANIGKGFFQVTPTLDLSGDVLFTRDGQFQVSVAGGTTSVTADDGSTITVSQGYLQDSNGNFLLGWTPEADGSFSNAGSLTALRADQYAFIDQNKATTSSQLSLNLPAGNAFAAASEQYNISAIDSGGNERSIKLNFNKTETNNTWNIIPEADNVTTLSLSGAAFSLASGVGSSTRLNINAANNKISVENTTNGTTVTSAFLGLKAGDSITLAGSGSGNDATYTISDVSADFSTLTVSTAIPATEILTTNATLSSTAVVSTALAFSPTGALSTPTSYTVSATWDDGTTSSFELDVSNLTQFDGDFTPISYSQNGFGNSNLRDISFDSAGNVVGVFEDGTTRNIYKIPVATFANPEGLEAQNGLVFKATALSGEAQTVAVDVSGVSTLSPYSIELSNVDMAGEFTKMIQVQQAYNSSATVFRTVDEMIGVARDLKS